MQSTGSLSSLAIKSFAIKKTLAFTYELAMYLEYFTNENSRHSPGFTGISR